MSGHAIRLEKVSKHFRIPLDRASTLKYRITHPRSSSRTFSLPALEDVDLEVPTGQFLGVVGHNGSGKSTLLKVLSRIYPPDSGRVEVVGRISPFLELGVGFNPELTARENVFLNGAVLGITRAQLEGRVDDILAFAGREVEQQASAKLKNFSSGMQVRLAFSVAIQADADVLLMDEVLAVGDQRFQEKCFDIFAAHKRSGRTIVLVTHDLTAVQMYCDRAVLIDHGRVIDDGTPQDVIAHYRRMVSEPEAPPAARSGGGGGAAPEPTAPPTPAPDGALPEPDGRERGRERWGSRELVITGVRLRDPHGETLTSPSTGAPVAVEVTYEAHAHVDDFTALIGFWRADGALVYGINSRVEIGEPYTAPGPGGTGTITYTLERFPLLGSGFALSVALYDAHATHAYDHIERAFPFHVIDERPRLGMVTFFGTLEHRSTAGAAVPAADDSSAAEVQSRRRPVTVEPAARVSR